MVSTNLKSRANGYSAEMDDVERASRDEIMTLQLKRLAWSLAHAYDNVAHYKKAFDKAGVHPSDFKQFSDLAKFPFTVKTDLRINILFICSPLRARNLCAFMLLPEPPASRSWSDIPGPTSRHGRT